MRSNFKQQGAALLVSLILLVIITMISVGGMQTVVMEERMSSNFRSHQLAFESAEQALLKAEFELEQEEFNPSLYTSNCTNGRCFGHATAYQDDPGFQCDPPPANFQPHLNNNTWVDNSGKYIESPIDLGPDIAQQPRYIVEFLCYGLSDTALTAFREGLGVEREPYNWNDSTWVDDYQVVFRITAVGYGITDTSRVMLQSIYKKNLEHL